MRCGTSSAASSRRSAAMRLSGTSGGRLRESHHARPLARGGTARARTKSTSYAKTISPGPSTSMK